MLTTTRMLAFAFLAITLASSCVPPPKSRGNTAPAPDPNIAWVTMHRGVCDGGCPVYEVAIFPGGEVRFRGRKFTKELGERTGRIDGGKMAKLQAALDNAVFLDLDHNCCNCMQGTDLPWATIEVREGTLRNRIEHYRGCMSAPKQLTELESVIDEVAGTADWVGTAPSRSL